MQENQYITIISGKKKIVLAISTILYVLMRKDKAEIHVSGGKIYETWMRLMDLEELLGEGFIKVNRGCLVAAMAIHNITDKINLSNGDSLEYTIRKKNKIIDEFHLKQKSMITSFSRGGVSLQQWRNITDIMAALIICPLHLQILK